MKVVIIEDELPAAQRLEKMLQESGHAIEVVAVLHSIRDALPWFRAHALPDLAFMDIELSDGLSLELVERANITCPIVFITAFDQYWQEAFEHNSIDYLLKPLKTERLHTALNKFRELREHFTARYQELKHWQENKRPCKERFLVKRGREFASIQSDDIAFFYATHKLVCLVDRNGSKYILDQSLAEVEKQVDPHHFFRASRKYLVHIHSIRKIHLLPKSKLLIELSPTPPDELVISSDNSAEFKRWMDR